MVSFFFFSLPKCKYFKQCRLHVFCRFYENFVIFAVNCCRSYWLIVVSKLKVIQLQKSTDSAKQNHCFFKIIIIIINNVVFIVIDVSNPIITHLDIIIELYRTELLLLLLSFSYVNTYRQCRFHVGCGFKKHCRFCNDLSFAWLSL